MALSNIKRFLPWWMKIASKIVLARLPIPYGFWKGIGLFEHGKMQLVEYADDVFAAHHQRAGSPTDFVGLELGPGDSLLSALVASKYGAINTHLIDAGDFANRNVDFYRQAEKELHQENTAACRLSSAATMSDLLRLYDCNYGTEGLASLKEIATDSVDFVWSQAVLEHLREEEFLESMREINRILKPNGVCSHGVDLKDHLGGALNNLRFSKQNWESDFMSSSGFYTNRIRYSPMLDLFTQAGFSVEVVDTNKWQTLPTPLKNLHEDYRQLGEDELLIRDFTVILRPVS